MHVAQKLALGLDPRVRSDFAICHKNKNLERRMNPFKCDAL